MIYTVIKGKRSHARILHHGRHTVHEFCISGILLGSHAAETALIGRNVEHCAAFAGKIGDVLLHKCLHEVHA